jgi:hypothetical protein
MSPASLSNIIDAADIQLAISSLHSLAVVSRTRKTPLAYQSLLQIAQIPDVSLKEGAVIGAVFSTRKFHRGHL